MAPNPKQVFPFDFMKDGFLNEFKAAFPSAKQENNAASLIPISCCVASRACEHKNPSHGILDNKWRGNLNHSTQLVSKTIKKSTYCLERPSKLPTVFKMQLIHWKEFLWEQELILNII